MKDHPLYPRQDAQALGRYYLSHVVGMTEADLDSKGDICEQLAWRDKRIAELEAGNRQLSVLVEHGNRCQTELFRVATEAAAMLAETNHGGLSFKRSASMQNALVAAHIPIPPHCSACPHGPGPEWLYCPRHCRVDHEPVKLVMGQRCPKCREVALPCPTSPAAPKCECKGTGTTVGPSGFRLCEACYPQGSPSLAEEQRQLAARLGATMTAGVVVHGIDSLPTPHPIPDVRIVSEATPQATPLHCHGCTDDMCPGCCDCIA